MEVSLQLYSIKEETNKDFKKAVEQVSQIGFKGVEFAGYGGLSAEELKTLLEENNLYSVGTHTGLKIFEESFEEELKLNKTIGSKYIICPYAEVDTKEKVDHLVKLLNTAAEKAAKENIKVGYHNHAHEFVKIDGKFPLDMIAENTSDNVILELDVFWVAYAGIDPVEYIKKWGKKVELIHMKQIDTLKANVDMGDGIIDMNEIKEASAYAKFFVLEHEEYDKPVWDSIHNDIDYLTKIK
ncbi:sugar phosphate isomerase/epimerase family protein [Anaerocolumna sp. MB42-C2]|uniref:sugar phosphate isomerase/epimerase family protein n=1 Tax=Anaerocolumna sp. MB42-C2 TaxID=3070997 RepID=UPI0027E1890E|nr:sugar phosphate isomerase/epimerase [Anaerocolumna sp. MB42-C2]WMJ86095.1 sugar phosphate isomerase/epimerase [Anaerocolumna sp. MB42-C2]